MPEALGGQWPLKATMSHIVLGSSRLAVGGLGQGSPLEEPTLTVFLANRWKMRSARRARHFSCWLNMTPSLSA